MIKSLLGFVTCDLSLERGFSMARLAPQVLHPVKGAVIGSCHRTCTLVTAVKATSRLWMKGNLARARVRLPWL